MIRYLDPRFALLADIIADPKAGESARAIALREAETVAAQCGVTFDAAWRTIGRAPLPQDRPAASVQRRLSVHERAAIGKRLAEQLVLHPDRSDREIARDLKISPTSVGKARAALDLARIRANSPARRADLHDGNQEPVMTTPIWHPRPGFSARHEIEVLASPADFERGECIAIVETFGYGWYANAMPPRREGTSSMIPGMIRRGNCGDDVAGAKAWAERICGLHPEKRGDRRSEPVSKRAAK